MSNFQNKVAIVTGARGGIGAEVVGRLRSAGYKVAAVGRDAATLAEVAADAHLAFDTTSAEGAAGAIAACQEQLGSPPAWLAHCVGSTLIAPLHRTTAAQYRELMRVNLDSAVYMLQAWIEAMRGTGTHGAAVLVSSVVARIGVANHEAIAAAKGGVEALARSAANMLKLPAMREGAGKQYPLGGVQTAGDVADTIAWLLSDGALRITGQVIAVDGGFTTVRPLVK
jgi:NAD(P)-dependent dehydrogenase (short-subunit alcohol dehydrogenase family)